MASGLTLSPRLGSLRRCSVLVLKMFLIRLKAGLASDSWGQEAAPDLIRPVLLPSLSALPSGAFQQQLLLVFPARRVCN